MKVYYVSLEDDETEQFEKLLSEQSFAYSTENNFQVVCNDKQVFYDAKKFIEDSQYYSSLPIPNQVQAAEKTWLSVVYALKKIFFKKKKIYNLSQEHKNQCRFFDIGRKIVRCLEGFRNTEMFHSFAYGWTLFPMSDFDEMRSHSIFLVREIEVEQEIGVCHKSVITNLGKETFEYKYVVC